MMTEHSKQFAIHSQQKERMLQIAYERKTAGFTTTQLELFELDPQGFELVEELVQKLPTRRQREYFRRFYMKAYHSIEDDGSIAWSSGNKKRYYANKQIREVLERRLVKVLGRVDFGVSWLSFNDIKYKDRYDYETDVDYEAASERMMNSAMKRACSQLQRPFYLLNANQLKKLAAELSTRLDSIKRDIFRSEFKKIEHSQDSEDFPKKLSELLYVVYGEIIKKIQSIGFEAPYINAFKKHQLEDKKFITALLKVTCEKWWLRNLQKAQKRMIEHIAIATGEVRKGRASYISRRAFNEYGEQMRRSYKFLKQAIVENVENPEEQIELFDMYLKSNSNPAIRRIEMMARLRGLEEWADEHRHHALFLTLTAPSKYHSMISIGGKKSQAVKMNPKYEGFSPRDTHKYLNDVWKKFRALLAKRNIGFYGMRVAESHHDATPHWHMLVYINPSVRDEFVELFERCALAEDGDEPGAKKHRCKVEDCDKQKGTATGYIVKYIAKNIDGFANDDEKSDEDDISMKHNAKRAVAWASLWGIRQFQLFGAPSVTAWRELRRLGDKPIESDDILEELRLCADLGDFAAYMQRQGGAMAKRTDAPAKIHYIEDGDNAYSEVKKKINGIFNQFSPLEVICTRLKKWAIKKKPTQSISLSERDTSTEAISSCQRHAWTCVNNCNPKKLKELSEGLQDLLNNPTPEQMRKRLVHRLWQGKVIEVDKYHEIRLINNQLIKAKKVNTSDSPLTARLNNFSQKFFNKSNITQKEEE